MERIWFRRVGRIFPRRRIPAAWLAALLALCSLTAAGCGNDRGTVDGNRYAEDGYLGMSNSNPNFLTNPAHHTYKKDRQLMRQALRELRLDKQTTIMLSGAVATVTIRPEEPLSPRQAGALRSEAYMLLKGHVPRYDYRIRIEHRR